MLGKVTVKIFLGGGGAVKCGTEMVRFARSESSEMLLRDLVITFTSHFPPPFTLFSVSFFVVCAQYYPTLL